MEIRFASRTLQNLCNSAEEMRARLGLRNAERLKQRLAELKAAVTLDDMRSLHGAACHGLRENGNGHFAVNVTSSKCLVFEPRFDTPPTKADGNLEWRKVTMIVIRGVVDHE